MAKNALILGGNGDIGKSISAKFRLNGFEVKQVGRRDFDLGNNQEITKFFNKNHKEYDVLIHCAAVNIPKRFIDISFEDLSYSVNVNVLGFLNVTKVLLKGWIKNNYGRVLVISSLYGTTSRIDRLPYTLSKHALNGVVKNLAIELSGNGVLVNSISPGYVDTKMTSSNNTEDQIKKIEQLIPLQRLGMPDDIAEIAYFLCSAKNTYINGQNIVVDGGFSIGGFYSGLI
ncbi:SDR family oxidoreductase [Betaproteobacteria bacterium]|nr:SDR family oxidoreductase [Betaproteobacteria bacterium]